MENLWDKNLILSSQSLKLDSVNYHKINSIFDKFRDEFNKTSRSLKDELKYEHILRCLSILCSTRNSSENTFIDHLSVSSKWNFAANELNQIILKDIPELKIPLLEHKRNKFVKLVVDNKIQTNISKSHKLLCGIHNCNLI